MGEFGDGAFVSVTEPPISVLSRDWRGVCLLFTECHKSTESDHSNPRGNSLVATETRA